MPWSGFPIFSRRRLLEAAFDVVVEKGVLGAYTAAISQPLICSLLVLGFRGRWRPAQIPIVN